MNYKRLACYEHCPGTFRYSFVNFGSLYKSAGNVSTRNVSCAFVLDKVTIIIVLTRLIINFKRSILLFAMNNANVGSKCGTESRGDMALCECNENRNYITVCMTTWNVSID